MQLLKSEVLNQCFAATLRGALARGAAWRELAEPRQDPPHTLRMQITLNHRAGNQ